MSEFSRWFLMLSLSLAVVIPAGGCFIAADLVSPELLSSYGLGLSSDAGKTLVALNNASSSLTILA